MTTTKLQPIDGRASFYGKALVLSYPDGWTYLKSYDTVVAGMSADGRLRRFCGRKSQTTTRHVKAFLRRVARDAMDIRGFYALEAGYPDEHPELCSEQ